MSRRMLSGLLAGALGLWLSGSTITRAQELVPAPRQPYVSVGQSYATAQPSLNRYWYYPYYYFPHNYWPTLGPKWPEPIGAAYQRPPAYMAYPPYKDPLWRYEYFEPQHYYRGFHFWLDQF